MGVPDTSKWKRLPGNFDVLNLVRDEEYYSDNEYGIPVVQGIEALEPNFVELWTRRTQIEGEELDLAWHFFTDDYRFEPVWNKPDKYLEELLRAEAVFTPDFSMYLEWPRAAQIWNTYRNRWLGAFWESHGISVIPTITWGDWRTYDFCFSGVAQGATVAISTMGVLPSDSDKDLFKSGYYAMVEAIQPSLVVVYGEQWEKLGLDDVVPVCRYAPTGVLEMRARLEKALDRRQLKLFVFD